MSLQTDLVIELPERLRMPALYGLTARELIAKCDSMISLRRKSWALDIEAHKAGDETTVFLYAETDPLCCPIAHRGQAEEYGIPRGLCDWILRRTFAETALRQPGLPFVTRIA